MYNKKEREAYNVFRNQTCEQLGLTKNQYNQFRRISAELHRIFENDCNGLYAGENEADSEAAEVMDRLETALNKLQTKLFYHIQTDPRGATVYLSHEPIDQTNYSRANHIW